jgi:hypothetical protein
MGAADTPAANSRVRALAERRWAGAGSELRIPPVTLCTDSGAMIAAVGDLLARSGAEPAPLDVSGDPSAPLEYAAPTPLAGTPARAARGTACRQVRKGPRPDGGRGRMDSLGKCLQK